MFKKSKIAVIGALVAGLLGSSIALAPAAEAASVSPQWSGFGTGYAKVSGHRVAVITTPSNRTVVKLVTKEKAYKSYRIVLKDTKTGKVYFNKVLSPWRTWWAVAAFNSGKTLSTTASVTSAAPASFSATQLKSLTSHLTKSSIHTLRVERIRYYDEFGKEDGLLYGEVGNAYDSLDAWVTKNGVPSNWDGYSKSRDYTTGGVHYVISGSPKTFIVKGTFTSGTYSKNVWVALQRKGVSGEYVPVPAASSTSAEANGMYAWLQKH